MLVRKAEVKHELQSLTATAAATSKTSCAAQAQPTAFKPTVVRAHCAALPYSPSAAVRGQTRRSPRAPVAGLAVAAALSISLAGLTRLHCASKQPLGNIDIYTWVAKKYSTGVWDNGVKTHCKVEICVLSTIDLINFGAFIARILQKSISSPV